MERGGVLQGVEVPAPGRHEVRHLGGWGWGRGDSLAWSACSPLMSFGVWLSGKDVVRIHYKNTITISGMLFGVSGLLIIIIITCCSLYEACFSEGASSYYFNISI